MPTNLFASLWAYRPRRLVWASAFRGGPRRVHWLGGGVDCQPPRAFRQAVGCWLRRCGVLRPSPPKRRAVAKAAGRLYAD